MTQTALTPAAFHVLLALADGARHGYAVMQAAEQTGPDLSWGPGTTYGVLQRLEDLALVRTADPAEASDVEAPTGRGKPRRYFALTSEGADALESEARRLEQLSAMVAGKDLATFRSGR